VVEEAEEEEVEEEAEGVETCLGQLLPRQQTCPSQTMALALSLSKTFKDILFDSNHICALSIFFRLLSLLLFTTNMGLPYRCPLGL
jgi:hypothetical protein